MSGRRSSNSEGSPGHHAGRKRQAFETDAACDGTRVAADQHGQSVLRLRQLPLLIGQGLLGRGEQRFGLARVEDGRDAFLEARPRHPQRLLPSLQGATGRFQLVVEVEQFEIQRGNLRDQADAHALGKRGIGQHVAARRFGAGGEAPP
jgi:hypothetical protein